MYMYSICLGCKSNEPSSDKCKCVDCKRCYADTDEEKYESLTDNYETY